MVSCLLGPWAAGYVMVLSPLFCPLPGMAGSEHPMVVFPGFPGSERWAPMTRLLAWEATSGKKVLHDMTPDVETKTDSTEGMLEHASSPTAAGCARDPRVTRVVEPQDQLPGKGGADAEPGQ